MLSVLFASVPSKLTIELEARKVSAKVALSLDQYYVVLLLSINIIGMDKKKQKGVRCSAK